MRVFYHKSKEWRLRFKYSLSVDHHEMLKNLVRDKGILDIGDRESPFLAKFFAPNTRSWTMVGRPPPAQFVSSSLPNLIVIDAPFSFETGIVQPSEVDLILFNFPSPHGSHDATALEWAKEDHMILFLGDPVEEKLYGSPSFWRLAGGFELQMDARDKISRLLGLRRKRPPRVSRARPISSSKRIRVSKIRNSKSKMLRKTEETHAFPSKGNRYHLSPTAYWPGKRSGDTPPVVEMICDWAHPFGPVKILQGGEVFHIQSGDLGGRLT